MKFTGDDNLWVGTNNTTDKHWKTYPSSWRWYIEGRQHVLLVVIPKLCRISNCFLILRARVGEDKTDGSAFQNINCYSSNNLVEWKYEGALLSRTDSGDLGPSRVIERPKVVFNKATNKYVLWMHIDSSNYGMENIPQACRIAISRSGY